MTFNVSFLTADRPICKEFLPNGEVIPYPYAKFFTSQTYSIDTLETLFEHLCRHATLHGSGLLKGTLNRELNNESRQGCTDSITPSYFAVLDVDQCDETIKTPDDFVHQCLSEEWHDTDYIFQYSNSAHRKPYLKGHFFFLLKEPATPTLLKGILTLLNFDYLNHHITLSANGLSLNYGLDLTSNQNDKLLFIAPPILHEPDPIDQRIVLIKHRHRDLVLKPTYPLGRIESLRQNKLKELRRAAGLPTKKEKLQLINDVEVLLNPDKTVFQGPYRRERGFVYGNLRGGDSYAYFHTDQNPVYLYNFKGEPAVRLQDIDPDYWKHLQQKIQAQTHNRYFVFRDILTDTFFTCEYTEETHHLHKVSNEKKCFDFLKAHQQPLPEIIPLWKVICDPTTQKTVDIDFEQRIINTFCPSPFMRQARPSNTRPPCFHELTLHCVGNDTTCQTDFINWLAFIFQYRTKTETAYVLHGRTGTGKGILFNRILRPLFGSDNCVKLTIEDFDTDFNDWMTNLIGFVDEAEVGDNYRKTKARSNRLKTLITEPTGLLKRKYLPAIPYRNHINFIFAGNEPTVVPITDQDRRFKIAKRQESRLEVDDAWLEALEQELQAIADYLHGWPVNLKNIRTIPQNADRNAIIQAGTTSREQFIDIIKTGDLDRLLLMRDEAPGRYNAKYKDSFIHYVEQWLTQTGQPIYIPTSILRIVYNFAFDQDCNAQDFGTLLAKHYMKPTIHRQNKTINRCVPVTWQPSNHFETTSPQQP